MGWYGPLHFRRCGTIILLPSYPLKTSPSPGAMMQKTTRMLAVCIATAVTLCPLISRAADDKPAEKLAEKPANTPAQSVTTQGTVNVGGQSIQYTAVAGIITVGATEGDDNQLGADGKPLPDTDLAGQFASAKTIAEQPPLAHMFYVAYFKRDADA